MKYLHDEYGESLLGCQEWLNDLSHTTMSDIKAIISSIENKIFTATEFVAYCKSLPSWRSA
jgi:hypothetical protein